MVKEECTLEESPGCLTKLQQDFTAASVQVQILNLWKEINVLMKKV